MARIFDRLKDIKQNNEEYYSEEEYSPEEYYEEPQQQYQQQPQQPQEVQYYDNTGFGDSRDSTAFAKEIERFPTPKGLIEERIAGRPIDLHMFEDYMVWKISPFQLRTVLRYRNARVMEEIKNYSSVPTVKFKGGTLLLIILFVFMLVIGILIMMYMPQLTEMFKGFI